MNYNIDDSEDGLTFSQKQEILNKNKREKEAKTENTEYRAGETINFYQSSVLTILVLVGLIGSTVFLIKLLINISSDQAFDYKKLIREADWGFILFLIIFFGTLAIKIAISIFGGYISKPRISITDNHIMTFQGISNKEKYIDLDFCEIARFQEYKTPDVIWKTEKMSINILAENNIKFHYHPSYYADNQLDIVLTPEAALKRGKDRYSLYLKGLNASEEEIKQALAKKYTAWYNKQQQNHQ